MVAGERNTHRVAAAMSFRRQRLVVDRIEGLHPATLRKEHRRPARGAARMTHRLTCDLSVALLVSVARVQHGSASELGPDVRREIGECLERDREQYDISELRRVSGRSCRRQWSKLLHECVELVRVT